MSDTSKTLKLSKILDEIKFHIASCHTSLPRESGERVYSLKFNCEFLAVSGRYKRAKPQTRFATENFKETTAVRDVDVSLLVFDNSDL